MLRKALLVCGIVSSLLYLVTIDVVAPLLYPEHHGYGSQMVSELIARDAPTRPLMFIVSIPYNLLVLAFAAGVWGSAAGKRAARLTALALAGYGLASSAGGFLAPMDLREAGLTEQTVLHIRATALQGVFMALVFVFGAFVHGSRFRLLTFGLLVLSLVFGGWAGIQAAQELPWIGITERVSIYAWMLWLLGLAVSFWNLESRVPARPTPPTGLRLRGAPMPPQA